MIETADLQKACEGNKEDAAELALAYNGRTAAMRAYNDRPGKDTDADLTAAEARLEKVRNRLIEKYFPKQAKKRGEIRFKTQKEARQHLTELGYRVSAGKFSQDSGIFTSSKGEIFESELLDYARAELKKDSNLTDLAARRELAETEKAEADRTKARIHAAQLERELDAEWMKRADADLQTCTWTAILRDTIAHRLSQNIAAIIHAAGGDLDHSADVQAIIDQAITDACNDVSNSGEVSVDIEDLEETA